METMQEIRNVMNVTSARNLMRELQVILDQWKENSETNTTHVKRDKAPMEPKCHFEERMTHIEWYWVDLRDQLEKGFICTHDTSTLLRKIEGVLTEVPRSHRGKLQARFSHLYAEAETMMDNSGGLYEDLM
ncbi:hypothetical protein L1987_17361 [Smallanthus sonchifolius]|uniref:Uncharacterized protein n=1 Tax=Smallanthus sonchifolius TaxID=185202 RepID=A0ACB9IWL6_9ASTR|nr:hypothetical protein L1987_17361 [Smallanthus sonchifolius]